MTILLRLCAASILTALGIGTAAAHPGHTPTLPGELVHVLFAPDHGLPFVLGLLCAFAAVRMARSAAPRKAPALVAVCGAMVVTIGWMAASLL